VQELTNSSLEDNCWHEIARDRTVVVRVGKNVDPTWYGYAPERRGTTFVMDAAMAALEHSEHSRDKKATRKDKKRTANQI
jgi:hypothetical protein